MTKRMNNTEERRRQILDAARLVFLQKGFYVASIDDVAAAAHVVRGTVLHYFKNKSGLMTAVLHAAFRIAASEHIPFIWLLPVNPAIYTPSGFEVICDFHAADHESSCLSHGLPEAALNKMNGALKENYDIFCVRDKTYLRRERIEATLDSGEEDSGLPENPKIMAKVTDGAVLRSMLPGKLREESPYDALRSLRCLFTEEV